MAESLSPTFSVDVQCGVNWDRRNGWDRFSFRLSTGDIFGLDLSSNVHHWFVFSHCEIAEHRDGGSTCAPCRGSKRQYAPKAGPNPEWLESIFSGDPLTVGMLAQDLTLLAQIFERAFRHDPVFRRSHSMAERIASADELAERFSGVLDSEELSSLDLFHA